MRHVDDTLKPAAVGDMQLAEVQPGDVLATIKAHRHCRAFRAHP
ncbi:MAG: hypothetical protein Q7S91_03735 [Aquabacterium sp.]|nr:hypothetical protein [Aquabacterium sp.]